MRPLLSCQVSIVDTGKAQPVKTRAAYGVCQTHHPPLAGARKDSMGGSAHEASRRIICTHRHESMHLLDQ